ncbi:MAG: flagellar basal-body rod protein FlgF [Planctomycetes bacterium]|nr:flagellar basal-body rod protein FlgF [Planctomycetota bacterium]
MIDGIYLAASGIDAYTKKQEIIASNLANTNTAGFKKYMADLTVKKEVVDGVEREKVSADISLDFTKGSLAYTGNQLDIAIDGEGMFVLETDEGLRYTRNGQFQLSTNGELITHDGGKLLGKNGPLIIPKGKSVISIDNTGKVRVDNKNIGELMINNFTETSALIPTGSSQYKASDTAVLDTEELKFKIQQGYLEKSNVNIVVEMVDMIENMRSYQVSNYIIKNFSETLKQLISSQSGV